MLTYLGILLIKLAEMIFSEYAPAQSTNWSIFYFGSMFASYSMITLDQVIKSYNKTIRLLFYQCFLFFIILFVQQLCLINAPYEFYYKSVNNDFIDLLRHGFFIVTIFIFSFQQIKKRWAKRQEKS